MFVGCELCLSQCAWLIDLDIKVVKLVYASRIGFPWLIYRSWQGKKNSFMFPCGGDTHFVTETWAFWYLSYIYFVAKLNLTSWFWCSQMVMEIWDGCWWVWKNTHPALLPLAQGRHNAKLGVVTVLGWWSITGVVKCLWEPCFVN